MKAEKLVPEGSLAWAWLNLAYAHQSPGLKPLFTLPSNFFPTQVLFGGFDRRGSAVAVPRGRGPCQNRAAMALSVPCRCGTNGMHDLVRAHVPPPGQAGALPLLMPAGNVVQLQFLSRSGGIVGTTGRAAAGRRIETTRGRRQASRGYRIARDSRLANFSKYAGTRHRIIVARKSDSGYSFQSEEPLSGLRLGDGAASPEAFEKAIDKPLTGWHSWLACRFR